VFYGKKILQRVEKGRSSRKEPASPMVYRKPTLTRNTCSVGMLYA
jgi:hypothetical protein